MTGQMIYLTDDLMREVKKVQQSIGIRSPSEALRVLIKKKKDGTFEFRI